MMRWMVFATVIAIGSGVPQAVRAQDGTAAAMPLAPGDIVRITIVREPELSGDFTVDETGVVTLPLVGSRHASILPAGAFKEQLRLDIGGQLVQAPEIMFLRRVQILGSVLNPGLYHVDATMTLADAIALAGGVQTAGLRDKIEIRRNGAVVRTHVDGATALTSVASGDEIYIPRRNWFARNVTFILGALIPASVILATR